MWPTQERKREFSHNRRNRLNDNPTLDLYGIVSPIQTPPRQQGAESGPSQSPLAFALPQLNLPHVLRSGVLEVELKGRKKKEVLYADIVCEPTEECGRPAIICPPDSGLGRRIALARVEEPRRRPHRHPFAGLTLLAHSIPAPRDPKSPVAVHLLPPQRQVRSWLLASKRALAIALFFLFSHLRRPETAAGTVPFCTIQSRERTWSWSMAAMVQASPVIRDQSADCSHCLLVFVNGARSSCQRPGFRPLHQQETAS